MQKITDKHLYIRGVEGDLYLVSPLERGQIETLAKLNKISRAHAADLLYAAPKTSILGTSIIASIQAIRSTGLDNNGT